uniref:CSON013291 protein n=1 Tax=Culicoides sonorensis TaxID=179676 RepID=A0A336KM29_CULSO
MAQCNLIDKQDIKLEIIKDVTKLFRISLENKNLSSKICTECLSTVQNISDYIDIVTENQEKLNSVEISVEPELETFIKVEEFFIKTENVDEPICHNEVQSSLPVNEPKKAPQYYECDICSQTFKRKIFLTQHMNKFHTTPVECEFCKKKFMSEKYLKNHILVAHNDGLLTIKNYTFCELCHDKPSFPTWEEMNEHYLENHQIQGYVKCCSKKFSSRNYFLRHLRVHNAPLDFTCVVCKKVMSKKIELKRHMTLHLPEEDKKFQCDQCERRFHLKRQLESHNKNVHETRDSVCCDICHKIFASRISYNQHFRLQHMEFTPEICPHCGKTAKSKRYAHKYSQTNMSNLWRYSQEFAISYENP